MTKSVKESTAPPPGRFVIGVGYNSDDGVVTGVMVEQTDLFGSGQRMALEAILGEHRRSFAATHEIPDLLGFELKTELFAAARDYQGFTREGTGGTLTIKRRIAGDLKLVGRYSVEHVAMETAAAAPMASGQLGEGVLSMVGAGLSYNTLDALARRGSRLELLAERSLGGDHQLERISGLIQHARPLGPFTLRLEGRASYVRSDDPMGVPLAHRVFHDGHSEVRGYAFDRGSAVGDNAEAGGRIDLELPIWKRAGLGIAVWADAGVRHNRDPMWGERDTSFQSSAGVSLVWRTRHAMLRLDVPLVVGGDGGSGMNFLVGSTF